MLVGSKRSAFPLTGEINSIPRGVCLPADAIAIDSCGARQRDALTLGVYGHFPTRIVAIHCAATEVRASRLTINLCFVSIRFDEGTSIIV
jgi:hypothetical protein